MKTPETYLIELQKGQDVRTTIINFAKKNNIETAQINAIGMLENFTIGFWNFETNTHTFKQMTPPHELTSFLGNITKTQDEIVLHAHATFTNHEYHTIGGHFGDGTVAVVMQCFIITTPQPLKKIT